jgi:hypothetical protein
MSQFPVPFSRLRSLVSAALLVFGVALGAGCETYSQSGIQSHSAAAVSGPTYVAVDLPVEGEAEGRPTYGMPILLRNSSFVLIPFTVERPQEALEKGDAYGAGRRVYGQYESKFFHFKPRGVVWHNVLSRNQSGNGEARRSRVIFDRRVCITSWSPVYPVVRDEDAPPPAPLALLFLAAVDDTNGDELINRADQQVAFVCEPDGGRLRRGHPEGTYLLSTRYDSVDQVFYFAAFGETSGDDELTTEDAAEIYQMPLDAPAPRLVVDEAAHRTVEAALR